MIRAWTSTNGPPARRCSAAGTIPAENQRRGAMTDKERGDLFGATRFAKR